MKILNKEEQEIDRLDLGIVVAGESKEYEYYLYNDTIAEAIDLKVEVPNKEVEVLESPKTLASKTKGLVKIKWSPSVTLKQGLQTVIKLSGAELYK